MVQAAWLFYFSKYVELLDTVRIINVSMLWLLAQYTVASFLTTGLFVTRVNKNCVCDPGVFCVEKEAQSGDIPAYLPSFHLALDLVVGHYSYSWWVCQCCSHWFNRAVVCFRTQIARCPWSCDSNSTTTIKKSLWNWVVFFLFLWKTYFFRAFGQSNYRE